MAGGGQRLDCVCSGRKQKRGNDKVYIGGERRGEGGVGGSKKCSEEPAAACDGQM